MACPGINDGRVNRLSQYFGPNDNSWLVIEAFSLIMQENIVQYSLQPGFLYISVVAVS